MTELEYRIGLRQNILGRLFEHQRGFVASGARYKAALCTRRAGKTYACRSAMVMSAIDNPGATVLYLGLTASRAFDVMWRPLLDLLTDLKIKYTPRIARMQVELENGSIIWLAGSDTADQVDKYRSTPYSCVILDEVAFMGRHVRRLINEALRPGLADYKGSMYLISTPSAACSGYFYEASTPPSAWEQHRWSIVDNKYFPQWNGKNNWQQLAIDYVTNEIKLAGYKDTDPFVRREWYGEWVYDANYMVYKYNHTRDDYTDNHPSSLKYVIGMDLGYHDLTTWVVLGFDPAVSPCVWEVHEEGASGLDVTAVAQVTSRLRDKYKPIAIVADSGGLGKTICAELSARHNLPVDAAEKVDKYSAVELMNSDFMHNLIKVIPGSEWSQEMNSLQWDPEKRAIGKFSEIEGQPNHYCDAALYAWRCVWAWQHKKQQPICKPGSADWQKEQEKIMFQRQVELVAEQQKNNNSSRRRFH